MLNLSETCFHLSAAAPEQLLRDGRPQVAFAGRSNVGKSSVLNCLCGRRGLARVSTTPGKTAHVNYFAVPSGGEIAAYLVDLPGYGYARVSEGEKRRWAALMEAYFTKNTALRLAVAVVDVRHTPTAQDAQMLEACAALGIPVLTLANKTDKLGKSRLPAAAELIRQSLGISGDDLILFSSADGTGRKELLDRITYALAQK